MKKQIILLNGASSSGKSTLAKYIQEKLANSYQKEFAISSIDDYLKMEIDETVYEDDVYETVPQFCKEAYNKLMTKEGLIVDYVITSERIFEEIKANLKNFKLLLVKVTCPLHELKRREEQRKDRHIGTAQDSYDYIYPKEGYDLVIDTYEMSLDECANKIISMLY